MDLEKFYPKGDKYDREMCQRLINVGGRISNDKESIYFDGFNFYATSELKQHSLNPDSDNIVKLGTVGELNNFPINPYNEINDWIIGKLDALKTESIKPQKL